MCPGKRTGLFVNNPSNCQSARGGIPTHFLCPCKSMPFPLSSLLRHAKCRIKTEVDISIPTSRKIFYTASQLCLLVSLLLPDNSLLNITVSQFPFPMWQCNLVGRYCTRLLWENSTIISLVVFCQVNFPKIYLEHKSKGMIAILYTEETYSIYQNMIISTTSLFNSYIHEIHKYINIKMYKVMGRWENNGEGNLRNIVFHCSQMPSLIMWILCLQESLAWAVFRWVFFFFFSNNWVYYR